MAEKRNSLLHPIHGVAAEDIAAELGHSTDARLSTLESGIDRVLRYLILRIRAFRALKILTGPDSGALVTPDHNGVIGLECQSEESTIQRAGPHSVSICPPAGGGGCANTYSGIALAVSMGGNPLPVGQCDAVGCDRTITLRLGDCLTGSISCDPDGNAIIDIGLDIPCICAKCGGGGNGGIG